MEKTKVIYIMGGARSGSTVLGIVLGNLKGVFYPGELFAWNRYKGVPRSTKNETRGFWKRVLEDSGELKKYFQYDFCDLMESYGSFKNFFKWGSQRLREDYRHSNAALFEKIRKISGAHTIVDSSHYALRAFWLSRDPRIELSLIYLVREPVFVMNAFLKKDIEQRSKHPLVANFYYLIVNFLSSLVYFFYPRDKKALVRYEDMIEEPGKTVFKITRRFGIKKSLHHFRDLKVGPLFEANRIKNKNFIDLKGRNVEIGLNFFWRFATKWIQFPFYVLFGYRL